MPHRFAIALFTLAAWLLATPPTAGAEWRSLGLSGRQVNRLHLHAGYLYACTDDGLHRLSTSDPDTFWTPLGFAGQTVYDVEDLGPTTLLAARALSGAAADTISLYRSTDGGGFWQPFQNGYGAGTGASGHQVRRILALAGAPNVILGMGGRIEKSVDGGLSWYPVSQSGALNAIAQSPANPALVWAGGETLIFSPYAIKSTDWGETWSTFSLFAGGDNAVDAIGCHPADSTSVYLGMEGRVMRTEDGGKTWGTMTSPNPSMYTFGMAARPSLPLKLYAAGASFVPDPRGVVFHQSLDGGVSWRAVAYAADAGLGVFDLLLGGVEETVYLATGNGVFRFHETPVGVAVEEAVQRAAFRCRPNPVFRTADFEFSLPRAQQVSLRILDAQGRVVARVVDTVLGPGPQHVTWDASALPAGIYFSRFQSGERVETAKVILVR